jgi:hypothetical protein
MWGSFNSHLNNVRSHITKVAHDVIEQAEELAAPPPPVCPRPTPDFHNAQLSRNSAPKPKHRLIYRISTFTTIHILPALCLNGLITPASISEAWVGKPDSPATPSELTLGVS